MGLVSNARKSVQYELMTGREWQHGLFIRDRWSVSSRLTLDLGLRWEYYPIMQRADRGIERIDLDTLDVLLGGRGGNPTNLGLEASKNNFAPRVGAIFRLNDNNVFRSGYGITYNPLPWTRPLRGFVPAHHRGQLPAEPAVQLCLDPRSGHPAHHRARSEQRPVPATAVGHHADAQAG